MSTSGSVDYSQTRIDAIQEAMELIGVQDPEETIESADYDSCNRSLNMMLKSWSADEVRIWKRNTGTLTLVASQASYTLGAGGDLVIDKPLRVIDAQRRDSSNIDTPMSAMSWDDYVTLSNKTLESIPTQYHYKPGLTTGTFYVWPVPTTAAASEYTIPITYYSLIEDMDAANNDFDLPSEWTETIAYNLALRIAPKFKVPIQSLTYVATMADQLYAQLSSWDEEETSVFFGCDFD